MNRCFRVVLCVLSLVFSRMMPAQNLPALQQDGAISVGTLQNGITYYLVTNASMKGVADYALVRRGRADSLTTRKELSSLPHFNKTVPYHFLARKGIGCRPEGYISYEGAHTVFRFDEVPVTDAAAADTTLLMLFDLIAAQPFQHAIIIAGDINAAGIQSKMNVFQMMVPARTPAYEKPSYSWLPSDAMQTEFTRSETPSVGMEMHFPRTADAQMNTIVPFIARMFATELGEIVQGRLTEPLSARNTPPRQVSFSYRGSDRSFGDDRLDFSVETVPDGQVPAALALSTTVSSLGKSGVGMAEYLSARQRVVAAFQQAPDNDALVRKCISHYLYGADLATDATKVQYFTSRNITPDSELRLFNDYVTALLDSLSHATLHWSGDEDAFDPFFDPLAFALTWENVSGMDMRVGEWTVGAADTTSFGASRGKAKLKITAPEPVSGGELWTFSNGIRVIYKKMNTAGRMYYSMMVKSGYISVKDLQRGEGAFFSDMLGLYDVAGMSGRDFQRVLQANGVELEAKVGVLDTRLSGSAPANRLPLTMKALLSLVNERKLNPAAYASFRSAMQACMQTDHLDGLMYPDYVYTDVRNPEALTDQLQERADGFFSNAFLRMNDGVLILVGDLPSNIVQKTLSAYLGGFRVGRTTVARPAVPYKLRTGTTTYSMEGSSKRITVAMAAQLPYTTEHYMAFRVACMALQRRLSGVLSEYGYSVSSTGQFRIAPQDVMEIIFTFEPVAEGGLPYGVMPGSVQPGRALTAARKAIDAVLAAPTDAAALATGKTFLLNSYARSLADPAQFRDAVLLRYAWGKDVLTGYDARINAVSAEKVGVVYKALSEGFRIEYVIK